MEGVERAAVVGQVYDFERVFVVHALEDEARKQLTPFLKDRRIFWVTLPELINDIHTWYVDHPRKAALRRSLTADLPTGGDGLDQLTIS